MLNVCEKINDKNQYPYHHVALHVSRKAAVGYRVGLQQCYHPSSMANMSVNLFNE